MDLTRKRPLPQTKKPGFACWAYNWHWTDQNGSVCSCATKSIPKNAPKFFTVFFYSRSITQLRRTWKKIESRYPRARTISTTLGFGSTRPSLVNTTGAKTLKSGQTGQQNGSIENIIVGLFTLWSFFISFKVSPIVARVQGHTRGRLRPVYSPHLGIWQVSLRPKAVAITASFLLTMLW